MKFAKTLLLIVCACTLQGCATYYYSSPPGAQRSVSSEGGEYYGSGVGYATIDYSSVPYYPWWSMDYYYLGPHYYVPWYSGYASGWYTSLGFSFAYPPYYRPYGFGGGYYLFPYARYAWYDPWYGGPWYGGGFNIIWYDTYWRNRYRDHARHHYPEPVRADYGNSRYTRRDLRRDLYPDPRDRAPASYSAERAAAGSRNVSAPPSYRAGDGGMEVRTRRDRKVKESHIGPAPVQTPSAPVAPARSISVAPAPTQPPAAAVMPSAPSQPVATEPRRVYQARPPQSRPVPPSRSSAPPPRPVREPPRPSSPAMPSRPPGSAERGAPDYDKGHRRRHN